MGRLRFGVVCAGRVAPFWQAKIIRSLLAWPGAEVAAIFECPPPSVDGVIWRWYWRHLVLPRARAMKRVDLHAELAAIPVIGADGPKAITRRARDLSLDVILNISHPAASHLGGTTDVPIWTFDYGTHSAAAPGLGELLRQQPTTRVRLTESSGGTISVLHAGTLPTQLRSYVHQLDTLLLQTGDWVVRAARQCALGGRIQTPPSGAGEQTQLPRPPAITGIQTAALGGRIVRTMGIAFRNLWRCEDWHVGIVDRPIGSFLTGGPVVDVRWIPPPDRNGSLGDPFPFRTNGHTWLLAEHYGFHDLHGRIVAMPANNEGGFGHPEVVMDDVVHMSYPFLVEHDGAIFCLPERGQARELALFRAIEFPRRWERAGTLLEDFPALDATIFRHQGRWWLFCTNADARPAIDLHAFHADQLEGPWHPHRLNPLKTDVATSRCAGTPFLCCDKLYRPAQDCTRGYGGAISLNVVAELTPDRFSEHLIATVEADPAGPYPAGIHTLSALGDVTLVDGKRYVANSVYIKRQLRRCALTPLRMARTHSLWPSN